VSGCCGHKSSFEVESRTTAGRSEAWRLFCRPGTNCLSYTSVAVQNKLRASCESRYTKLNRKQRSGPDLSCFTRLSKYLNANAKTVTNLLILLSVLACVILFQILCPLFIKDKYENSSNQESW